MSQFFFFLWEGIHTVQRTKPQMALQILYQKEIFLIVLSAQMSAHAKKQEFNTR